MGTVKQDKAEHNIEQQDRNRLNMIYQAYLGQDRQDRTGQEGAWQDRTGSGTRGQDRAMQPEQRSLQHRARQRKAGLDWTGQDTGQTSEGQGWTRPGKEGQCRGGRE